MIPSFRNSLEDLFDYSIDWGDGTISQGSPSAGSLTDSHSYAEAGEYPVTLRLNDDDTGEAVWNGSVTVESPNQPPISQNDVYQTVRNTTLTEPAAGVLANDWDDDGDAITAVLDSGPSNGTLNYLNPDGSFEYVPNSDFVGIDIFTYYAFDGEVYGIAGATVAIDVAGPTVDIDVDSDNDGTLEANQEEEEEESFKPGKIVGVGRPPDEVQLSYDAAGANLNGYKLTLTHGDEIKLWKDADKQEALPLSFTIGTDQVPGTVYVEALQTGQTRINWDLENPAQVVVAVDFVDITAVAFTMTAYRPQTDPFPDTAVPPDQEESPGAGIRRNGDDDDNDGTADNDPQDRDIADENDLIRLDLLIPPLEGVAYVLERSNANINVWAESDKGGSELLDESETDNRSGVYFPSGGSTGAAWVEWANMDAADTGADLKLHIRDTTENDDVYEDEIHFYPFTSIVVGFMGEFQQPETAADQGMYEMIYELYTDGYDAYVFEEDDLGDDYTPQWDELLNPDAWWEGELDSFETISNAAAHRGVTEVAIFGFSHGGGATYELTQILATYGWTDDGDAGNGVEPLDLLFTGYIDGVEKGVDLDNFLATDAEVRMPLNTAYHYNVYQSQGDDPNGGTMPGASFNDDADIDVAGADFYWANGISHSDMDDAVDIQTHLLNTLRGRIGR